MDIVRTVLLWWRAASGAGIIRRGVVVEALRESVLKQGPSRNVLSLEWGAFWALNKQHIDPVAPRHTAVFEADAIETNVHPGGNVKKTKVTWLAATEADLVAVDLVAFEDNLEKRTLSRIS